MIIWLNTKWAFDVDWDDWASRNYKPIVWITLK